MKSMRHFVSMCGTSAAVVSAMAFSSVVHAEPDRGLLFYAGFEGTLDAAFSRGDGRAVLAKGRPGLVEGVRGRAVRCGVADGNLAYPVEKNLNPAEGTIEMWFSPADWDGADHEFHVFFRAVDPGWLQLYKYGPSNNILFLTSADRKTWTCASNFRGPELKQGRWYHLAATWKEGEVRLFLDGREHPPAPPLAQWLIPRKVTGQFTLGDPPQDGQGRGTTLLDEVYVYGRALSEEEIAWIVREAKTRPPGADVPAGVEPAVRRLALDTDLATRSLIITAELNPRYADRDLAARARIVTDNGSAAEAIPETILAPDGRRLTGKLAYGRLAAGDYAVAVDVLAPGAKETVCSPRKPFAYPGDGSEWQGNRIGVSDTPPPPWPPIEATEKGFRCWGREYALGSRALLDQVTSGGKAMLARPVRLEARAGGEAVAWTPRVWTRLSETPTAAMWIAAASSPIGDLEWRVTAEFDGFVRYDIVLQPPADAEVEKLELRFPVKAEHAECYYLTRTVWGLVPSPPGEFAAAEHTLYSFLGNDERGVQVSIPSDEPWQEVDRKGMVRLERTADSVDIVWSFAEKPWRLPRPWRASFAVQATPVKDITGWRRWRFSRQADRVSRLPKDKQVRDLASGTYYIHFNNAMIFDNVVPAADDPTAFRAFVEASHAGGEKFIQYLLADYTSPRHPMWLFRMKQYYLATDGHWTQVAPSPDWMDWHVYMIDRFLRDYDQDGLYYDLSAVPTSRREPGPGVPPAWYVRDGVRRPTYYLFETRELYKRLYTAAKAYGAEAKKDTRVIAHSITHPLMAVHGFCDMGFQGEDITDHYEKTVPPALLRVKGLSTGLGLGAFWLPQRQAWEKNRVEQSIILMGRLLLHDVQVWNCYIDEATVFAVYDAQNRFGGIADAEFFPYWRNGGAIAGQTGLVKASAYVSPRPGGGSLITAANLSDAEQRASLTLDPARLHASSPPRIQAMMPLGRVESAGNAVTVTIPPYGFVMVEAK